MYSYGDFAKEILEQLSDKGVFLTVKDGDKINTMTIGWGSLSQYWGTEVFIAPVRKSRFTYNLLKNAKEFTVSVPAKGAMDEALRICGTRSGRDCNKFELAGIKTKASENLSTPLIDGCSLYLECKTLCEKDLLTEDIPEEIRDRWYSNNDMHTLFFGKMLSVHR